MPFPRTPKRTRGSGLVQASLGRGEAAVAISAAQPGSALVVTAAPNKDANDTAATGAVTITGASGIASGTAGNGLVVNGGAPNGAGTLGTGNAILATGGGPGNGCTGVATSGTGILGQATTGVGVTATNTSTGYALQINGDLSSPSRAFINAPVTDATPTGAHVVGDLIPITGGHWMVCTVAGTPGTWRYVGWTTNDTLNTTGGTTMTINWQSGQFQTIDLEGATGNVTLTLSNPVVGAEYKLEVIQGSVARNLIWPAAVKWPAGTAPTISAANNAVDYIRLLWDGTIYMGTFNQAFA